MNRNTEVSSVTSNPAVYECMKKLEKYDEVLSNLHFALPNVVKSAMKDITSIKVNEMNAEGQLRKSLERIRNTVKETQKLKLASVTYMDFWKAQPLAEGSPSCPKDYSMWRERCREAMKTIRLHNDEFDERLDNSNSLSSSSGEQQVPKSDENEV